MMKKNTCRKKWGILFITALMVCYLCMPSGYTSAAAKDITSTLVKQQFAQAASVGVELTETKVTVVMGSTLTLTFKNLDDSKVSTIKWKSDRTSVAKVNQQGVVTPVRVGTTTVKCTITYKDKNEQALNCMVTVEDRVKATKVTITNKSVSLPVGESLVLKPKLFPDHTTDQVYWFSNNKAVATVGLMSGEVTAKKTGTVIITAKVGKERKDAIAKTNRIVTELRIEVTATEKSLFVWREDEDGIAITGYKTGLPENVAIPEKINGITVTSIAYQAFSGCMNLKSVSIPEGVKSIDERTFSGCGGLESVTIPKSVTEIGSCAFEGCSNLKKITIPEGIKTIASSAFSYCSGLENVTIPKSVTSIGWQAFYGCGSLKKITIPNSVTSIGDYAFEGCSSL